MGHKAPIVRTAGSSDYLEICEWIVDISQDPKKHCLHSWAGEPASSLASDLNGLVEAGELVYLVAREGKDLVGALGAEFDESLGQTWIKGPQVTSEPWDEMANTLFQRLILTLPTGLHTFYANLNHHNQQTRDFFVQKGFVESDRFAHTYSLESSTQCPAVETQWGALTESHRSGFLSLYETLFKGAYYTGERILDMVDSSHRVFVSTAQDEVSGFCVVSLSEDESQSEIEFLGVDSALRKKGLGRQLLLTALHSLKERNAAITVALNVNDALAGARHLYESVGFKLLYSGIALTKRIGQKA